MPADAVGSIGRRIVPAWVGDAARTVSVRGDGVVGPGSVMALLNTASGACVGHGGERCQRGELQDDLDDAIVEAAADGETDGSEHELHVGVAWHDGRGEPEQASIVGDDGEPLVEEGGDSLAVVVIGDGEGDFGLGGLQPMMNFPIPISSGRDGWPAA